MLPYTAEALFAQLAQYNAAWWPAAAVAAALALAVLALAVRPTGWSGRFIAAVLAAGWIWTGIAWHLGSFSTLNFAAPAYGALFILQGLLLGWDGAVRGWPAFRFHPDAAGWAGLALAVSGLLLYPLADGLAGHGWTGVRIAGVAPAPTAAFTLGLLLLAEGRVRWRLAVLPLLWTAAAGAIGWILDIPQDVALAAAGVAALALAVRKNARAAAENRDR